MVCADLCEANNPASDGCAFHICMKILTETEDLLIVEEGGSKNLLKKMLCH